MANAYVGPDILPVPNVFFMLHSKNAQTQVGLSYNFHGILSQCIVIFLFCVHIVVECEIGCKVSILDFFKWSLLFFIQGNYGLIKKAAFHLVYLNVMIISCFGPGLY